MQSAIVNFTNSCDRMQRMWVYAADQLGRVLTYYATGWRHDYLCALAWECEQIGFVQWGFLRRALDRARGEGHCRQMWMEVMGYDD